ncbi:MAG: nitroreductase family protein [Propionibacteriaceae bacterium]|nr:nitroreductase family protein [Propionibacteriaceae bacterium]
MSTIDELLERKSIRIFEHKPIPDEIKAQLLECAFAAPTCGTQMLYSIIEVEDPVTRARLAKICQNQQFIARAPWLLVFLADCRRWYDCYELAGLDPRPPIMLDMLLAYEDACYAAQNLVVAAQSIGIGSCYIGLIHSDHDEVVKMLDLDEYVIPAAVLILGYTTPRQQRRRKPPRFDPRFLVFKNKYRRLSDEELKEMFVEREQDFDKVVRRIFKTKYQIGPEDSAAVFDSVGKYMRAFGINQVTKLEDHPGYIPRAYRPELAKLLAGNDCDDDLDCPPGDLR